jgi:tetratricopeptide (TPR) repeat protein
MSDELLARLQAAESAEERDWLVTEALLESLPAELQQATWAAAVPHWFDAQILAALLEKAPGECDALYADLQGLPFVEPFQAREGHNVHEVTREAMLARLWEGRRDEYRALSARAAAYFAGSDEAKNRIEEIYHQLIADPDAGAKALYDQGWEWHDPPLIAYDLVYALADAALEHDRAGRLDKQGAGTANLLSGRIDTLYARAQEAMDKLEAARQASEPGSRLRADSHYRLGDVHHMVGEYAEARKRFVEALGVYASIGNRRGEADCILGLGDVHRGLEEYTEARDRYEEARTIYSAIGHRRGEAHCIHGLGDVNLDLEEYAEAQDRYEEALAVYTASGNRLMEALCLKALGSAHSGLGEPTEARNRYEKARRIYAALGVRLWEAHCTLRQGEVALAQKDWPEAERLLQAALAAYRELGMSGNVGASLIRLGDVARWRGDRSAAEQYYREALDVYDELGEKESVLLIRRVYLEMVRRNRVRRLWDRFSRHWRDR